MNNNNNYIHVSEMLTNALIRNKYINAINAAKITNRNEWVFRHVHFNMCIIDILCCVAQCFVFNSLC